MDALLVEKGLMARLGNQLQNARHSVGDQASSLVINAMAFLGVPYKYGGNTVETGFDCSGFVRAVYEQSLGKILPRRSDEQAAATEVIDRSELKPATWCFSTPCAARSATWASTWVTASSSTRHARDRTCAWKTCAWLTGTPALTGRAACPWPPTALHQLHPEFIPQKKPAG